MNELAQRLQLTLPSPLQPLTLDWPGAEHLDVFIKRDDLIHAVISGNKWRKLKYALSDALAKQTTHIVSFGGGHSNHLHALGYVCYKLGIRFTAIIRGDYSANPTPSIKDLHSWQTNIQYVDKLTYRNRENADYLAALEKQYPQAVVIPEGGSQQAALTGVAEIVSESAHNFDYIICPIASGGTMAGLITAVAKHTQVIGIGVLKGEGYLEDLLTKLLPKQFHPQNNWQILHNFHHGGYAKTNAELTEFCLQFQQQTQIPVEPVYSGKLMFAFKQMLAENLFPAGARIMLLHTGGIQGARTRPGF